MSITAETAKAHAKDPAVLCCRAEAGITIEPANLEDPAIFDELVDSGLLNLDGCLTIEQVLGAKLTKTSDSLCPLTADNVDGINEVTEEEPEEDKTAPEKEHQKKQEVSAVEKEKLSHVEMEIGRLEATVKMYTAQMSMDPDNYADLAADKRYESK